MMYIHYCRHCQRIHILNGHKYYCPRCKGHLVELKISYMKYVNLDRDERQALRRRCNNTQELFLLTVSPDKTRGRAKWLQISASNIENYHSDHYAAYSH